MGRHKNSLAGLWAITCSAPTTSARSHQPESAREKRLRARGEGAPEPPVMRNTTLQFTANICGGRLLQRHSDIGCMLQRHDAIRPAVDEGPLAFSLLRCRSEAPAPLTPFQSFISWP